MVDLKIRKFTQCGLCWISMRQQWTEPPVDFSQTGLMYSICEDSSDGRPKAPRSWHVNEGFHLSRYGPSREEVRTASPNSPQNSEMSPSITGWALSFQVSFLLEINFLFTTLRPNFLSWVSLLNADSRNSEMTKSPLLWDIGLACVTDAILSWRCFSDWDTV